MTKTEKLIEHITNKLTIDESSLSRVYKHTKEHDSGTISACRKAPNCGDGEKYNKNENIHRTVKLKSKLLALGYSITKIDGVYIEYYGTDKATPVKETSFLVVDMKDNGTLKNDLMKLGIYFEQDSITFSTASGEYYLISTNECSKGYPGYGKIGVEVKLGKPMFSKSGEFYSRINNRPFIFESAKCNSLEKLTDHPISSIRSFVYTARSFDI